MRTVNTHIYSIVWLSALPANGILWGLGLVRCRPVARWVWNWWGAHWLRTQSIATPIASLLVALALARAQMEGMWERRDILVAAVDSASAGALIYTASFAALEGGIGLMALAWYIHKRMEKALVEDQKRREGEQREKGRQEGLQEGRKEEGDLALRAYQELQPGEDLKDAMDRLRGQQNGQTV